MDTLPAFDEIPLDWRVPGADLEIRPVYTEKGVLDYPAAGLIMAQKLADGIAVPGQLYRITRPEEGALLCGDGSIGDDMVRAARLANKTSDIWLVTLADAGAAVKATGKFVFDANGSGVVNLYVGGRRARVLVTPGMTAAARAEAAVEAINADGRMPVVAVQGGVGVEPEVILTAKHAGESGNAIDLRVGKLADEILPAGMTITITAMTSGAGNPDVSEAIDAINERWFQHIVMPWTDDANLIALAEELRNRFTATGRLDGQGYVGLRGTFGQLTTKGGVTNSPHMTLIGASGSVTSPWIWGASLMAVSLFHLTQDPARQLRTLRLAAVEAPDASDLFNELEQDLLLRQGVSTFTAGLDRSIFLSRVITTYKASALGAPDSAWLDITVPATVSRIRYDWRMTMALTYPRHKLEADGGVAAAYSDVVATPRSVKGTWAGRCTVYARAGWIQDTKRTLELSTFQIDPDDKNHMVATQRIDVMGNLIRFSGVLAFEA
jgi:phage tail sheath gpL-like